MISGRLLSPGGFERLPALAWPIRSSRYLPVVAGILAIVLALPALSVGWLLDDYYHRAVLLEIPRFRELLGTPAEMFRFFRGDPTRMSRLMDLGLFPWWTDPYIKAEFLQALTVLTHRLDYIFWPDSPVLMHAQSLFWLGAAVAAAAAFYQRIMGPTRVAAVAALLFAVDDARGATAGFLANRNVLIAATFGFSALIFHDRFRKDRSRPAAFLAPLLLLAALFTKEEGIGTCAYLAAYALFVDRGVATRLPGPVAVRRRGPRLASTSLSVGLRGLEHGRLRRSAHRSPAIRSSGRPARPLPAPRSVDADTRRSCRRAAATRCRSLMVGRGVVSGGSAPHHRPALEA